MPIIVRDGAYDQVGGLAINAPEIDFPFEKNGDLTSIILTQTYKQTPAQWRADRVAGRYLPGVSTLTHATYGTLYLLAQSRPTATPTGLYAFTRDWARIPLQQIESSYKFVTKPALSSFATNTGFLRDLTGAGLGGDVYLYSSTALGGGKSFSVRSAISSVTMATGGTFTLTFGADTTAALAYNASDATITTAINGLASVIGAGLTFAAQNALYAASLVGSSTGPAVILTITVGSTSSVVTMNPASLTPTACTSAYTSVVSAAVQIPTVMHRAAITAHGYTAADDLIMHLPGESPEWSLLPDAQWEIVDADTIAFFSNNVVSPWDMFGQEGGGFTYTEGTVLSRIKLVTDYYLPGVSPGINSVDDIPLPLYQGSPGALVGAILAGTTSINLEVGELAPWRQSPILARTITTANAATL